MVLAKQARRLRIKRRIRCKIHGTPERPRMTVFRSNKQIYVQFVDDENGVTLAAASSKVCADEKGPKIQQATAVGKLAAEAAIAKGIKAVVFDRNGYQYHGRVKALAEAAREAGLLF